VTVIAIAIARVILTFERHLIGNFKRLTQRQNDFGSLVLKQRTYNNFYTHR